MNSSIKDKWCAALESGEYSQCQDKLKRTDGYCCLGVLTDIYIKENNLYWERQFPDRDWFSFDKEFDTLPVLVRNWAGLDSIDPFVVIEDKSKSLSELNDSGYDFKSISHLIREQL